MMPNGDNQDKTIAERTWPLGLFTLGGCVGTAAAAVDPWWTALVFGVACTALGAWAARDLVRPGPGAFSGGRNRRKPRRGVDTDGGTEAGTDARASALAAQLEEICRQRAREGASVRIERPVGLLPPGVLRSVEARLVDGAVEIEGHGVLSLSAIETTALAMSLLHMAATQARLVHQARKAEGWVA